MQEKAAAGTDSSAKGTRKPKNLDKNAEMEVTDAGSEVKDEGSMHEPTASSGADDDGGHAEIASASTAIHAPHVAAVASRPSPVSAVTAAAGGPSSKARSEHREKSMAERLRFKRRSRRQVR